MQKQKFQQSVASLKKKGTKRREHLEFIAKMHIKKSSQNGVVRGFHGTSQKRARLILEQGFRNFLCEEGGYGVYFWDEIARDNAFDFAKEKAKLDRDDILAVFEAEIQDPEPDYLEARPQWIVDRRQISILDVYFFRTV